ncbi:PREDICTED: golgin candidate 2-like isoform X3 [Camelina sativa]|uniref:Golgin candidate 2-like isoform X1 n=1 Tax=Camelina sativa TaxID=90675 RepID=A0ABM0WW30_CAMSA|nr:PREDICTED: golgin candidate 2-like isoform X2 [Camelina sativa]XP_010476995.1 PREDICTED: golgin candidate 2-like isoform X1 [Camelina sativa]XP_010476997.1 PREDICTED: golgin candidate 2-like isoform X3 [Camelina sativa]
MANWISSKLKAAETILQQLDQQAAESLRKDEKSETHDEVFETSPKSGSSPVSLKDQLRKKTYEGGSDSGSGSQRNSVEQKPPSYLSSGKKLRQPDQSQEKTSSPSQGLTQDKTNKLTDNDWTELLSSPSQVTSTLKPRSPGGTSVTRGLKKDGKRHGNVGKNPLVSDGGKKSTSANVVDSRGRPQKQPNKEPSDKEVSSPSDADMERRNTPRDMFVKSNRKVSEKDVSAQPPSLDDSTRSAHETLPKGTLPSVGKKDGREPRRSAVWGKQLREEVSQSNVSDRLKRKDSSLSSDESESDYESDSSTDSERERQREERRRIREKIFAEKIATKAVAIIKERENMVARLEGEKQSLEKIVEERAKQQAQEAAELQTNMMETLEAADLEKQKHNNTRMEVLTRLAGLEAANAELTRSLAAGQKKLETQIEQVAVLRQQVELKESTLEELKRNTFRIGESGSILKQLDTSRGDIFEHQMLEAEISLLTDKIGRLQDKATKLEADIEMMRKELEEPTEVEIELKRRLNQLTDHLIQKQSQVEALSSEKATISFRIEAVSRLIEENKGMSAIEAASQDLEAGDWELSGSKFKPAIQDKIRSGKKHLGWLVMQLNAIFVSGTVFLRRNPTAKIWAVLYLVCLHLWVLYILLSHSDTSSSGELRSGAVISLENFSNSSHR